MEIKNALEKAAKQAIVNKVVDYLDKNPEKNVNKIFAAVKKLNKKDKVALEQIAVVEDYYNNDECKHKYIQDILTNTDSKCLKKFFTNFFCKC
ncbi:uncharacterized protein (DUF2164 family) [Clostridium acetobutylicum]|nr:uncharacterized protein (DUF2164 family) [Clostridium acetobutylicum]